MLWLGVVNVGFASFLLAAFDTASVDADTAVPNVLATLLRRRAGETGLEADAFATPSCDWLRCRLSVCLG